MHHMTFSALSGDAFLDRILLQEEIDYRRREDYFEQMEEFKKAREEEDDLR